MRDLTKILNQIIEIEPSLGKEFKSLKDSIKYTAPELMYLRWNIAAEILENNVSEHPRREEIGKIFSGS